MGGHDNEIAYQQSKRFTSDIHAWLEGDPTVWAAVVDMYLDTARYQRNLADHQWGNLL